MRRFRLERKVAFALLAGLASSAPANWQAVNLGGNGIYLGGLWGIAEGQQVGYGRTTTEGTRAGIWHGVPGDAVFLTVPNTLGSSQARCTDGVQQGGFERVYPGVDHARLWTGSIGSMVDLHPAGKLVSRVQGVDNGQQVGCAAEEDSSTSMRACLWNGTAASYTNLQGTGEWSEANGVESGKQVGFVVKWNGSFYYEATTWAGTPGSQTSLHPSWATGSMALAIDGGRVAGYASDGSTGHALIWTGGPNDYIDLTPPNVTGAVVRAIEGDRQAGHAVVGNQTRAAFWQGTKETYVDLHAFLPAEYRSSYATGVHFEGTKVTVVGVAVDSGMLDQPVMWVFETGPERVVPTSMTLNLGKVNSGNVQSLGDDDQSVLTVCKFVVPNQTAPFVQYIVDGSTTNVTPSAIFLRSESKAMNAGNYQQTIEMANFANFSYDLVRTDILNQTYQSFDAMPPFPPAQYIGTAGLVRARISVKRVGPATVQSPCVSWDVVNWYVTP